MNIRESGFPQQRAHNLALAEVGIIEPIAVLSWCGWQEWDKASTQVSLNTRPYVDHLPSLVFIPVGSRTAVI